MSHLAADFCNLRLFCLIISFRIVYCVFFRLDYNVSGKFYIMHGLLDRPIAHRGLFSNGEGIPENSMLAFAKAADAGYPVELDIQMLHDGTLVVFHDRFLNRMTGRKRSLRSLSARDLKDIPLLETSQRIPLLSEVLELVDGRIPLLLEIKSRQRAGRIEQKLLHAIESYKGEYAVESFNPLSIRWFRDNAVHVRRGLLSGAIGGGKLLYKKALVRGALFYRLSRPDFIAYDIKYLPARSVARLREKGFPVIGYTAMTRQEFDAAMKYCDNVIFEGFVPGLQAR